MADLKYVNNAARVKDLASYCYACGACDSVCPTNHLKLFSPRSFIVRLVNEGVSDIDRFIKKEELFYCLTCKQCSIHCPMFSEKEEYGVKFVDIIHELRAYGFERGLLDSQLRKHRTHDGFMQLFPKLQGLNPEGVNDVSYLKEDRRLKTADEGEIGLFIGCVSSMSNTFYTYNIDYQEHARSAIKLLNLIGVIPVVINQKCCGHDAYWTGDVQTAKKLAEFNVDAFIKAGVKTVIVNCAEGYRMWKEDYKKLVDNYNLEVYHITEYLMEHGVLKKIKGVSDLDLTVTYHDPCRLGRFCGVYDAPRELLEGLEGVKLVEMEDNREDSLCCGVSTFMACNGDTKRIREVRIEQAVKTGANYLVTTCPKCLTHFSCYLNEMEDDGTPRKTPPKINVMDLTTFLAKMNRN